MIRSTRMTLAFALSFAALAVVAADRTVFRDDFSDSGSGWIDTQVADHNAKGIALYNNDGGYQMTPVDDATYGIVPAPKQAGGADVQVEAGLFLYTGVGQGTGGVVCRHRDNDNFYAFMVSGGHGYAVLKVQGGKAETLASGRFEGTMPNIADLRIGARCEGSALKLMLDGNVVAEASDSAHAAGQVGLIVMGEKMAGTSAVFDDFELRSLAR
jgi:hypothetical protein